MIPPSFYSVDTLTGCWNYKGRLLKNGRPAQRLFNMHCFRVLCWIKHGPPPEPSFHAAHLCHNRRCINPYHSEWQPPEVNNPRKSGANVDRADDIISGVNVIIKRRISSKGGGRRVEGWCAVFRLNGKQHKSGAYYSIEAAKSWAADKILNSLNIKE